MADLTLTLWAAGGGGEAVWGSVLDVLILLGAALTLGTLAERLGQSPIVGYLVAGMVVGPNALGWIDDQEDLFQLSELGVALLLFTIGLEFSLTRLKRLSKVVLVAGPIQVVTTTVLGLGVALLAGLPLLEAVCVGSMVALSSTAVALRILRDRAELDTPPGRTSLGILIVQDLAVVPFVLLITALSSGGTAWEIGRLMLTSTGLGALLVGGSFVVFNYVAPFLLNLKSMRLERDLPILLAVVMAGLASWTSFRLGLSPALGAFVAGMLLAVSPFANQVNSDVQALKTLMVTLFFAAIGLFGDPIWLVQHLHWVGLVVVLVVVGKAAIIVVAARLADLRFSFGLATGFSLAQIGEFSFVLAGIAYRPGEETSLMSEPTFRVMVSATIVTMLLTPYLISAAPWLGTRLQRLLSGRDELLEELVSPTDVPRPRVLIIGFGPAAQRLVEQWLSSFPGTIEVLDLNRDNLKIAEQYGIHGHLGDATRIEILEHLNVADCDAVAITLPSPKVARELVGTLRAIAPKTTVAVRSRYHIYYADLIVAGADVVVNEEDQVGQSLAAHLRQRLQQEGVWPSPTEPDSVETGPHVPLEQPGPATPTA